MGAPPSSWLVSHLHFNWGPLLPPWGLELCSRKNWFCLFHPHPLDLLRITMKVASIGHDRPDPYQDLRPAFLGVICLGVGQVLPGWPPLCLPLNLHALRLHVQYPQSNPSSTKAPSNSFLP